MLRSFGDVKFDLGPLLQVKIRASQHKSAYISLTIGSRGFQCTVDLQETICCEYFDVKFDLEGGVQGQTWAGQHKSAYTLFIIGSRGF